MPIDSFEQWRRRPVYVVQCFSCLIARTIVGSDASGMFRFRAKPQYRDAAAHTLRRATAERLREMRRSGEMSAKTVRENHESILASPGRVSVVDLSTVLPAP